MVIQTVSRMGDLTLRRSDLMEEINHKRDIGKQCKNPDQASQKAASGQGLRCLLTGWSNII